VCFHRHSGISIVSVATSAVGRYWRDIGSTSQIIQRRRRRSSCLLKTTHSPLWVHHCRRAILPVHWTASKAVLAFHAGSGVSKLKTTTKYLKEAACLELYYNTIESLDEEHFDKAARDFFCLSFQKNDEPMPTHSLYRYYRDSRAKIRNQVLPYFPRNLVTMKSGRGFHESCNEVYVKAYREEMPIAKLRNGTLKYAEDELVNLLPAPQHWEFTKSPWYFGLLVKIF
jgi:hypothetical protein